MIYWTERQGEGEEGKLMKASEKKSNLITNGQIEFGQKDEKYHLQTLECEDPQTI